MTLIYKIYYIFFLFVSLVAFAKAFNLAIPINLLTHYAKGTPLFLFIIKTSTAYRVTNSRLFQIRI